MRKNQIENLPLIFVDKIKKQPRGTCDVVVDYKSNVTLVWWKDNKVVTVASTVFGKEPMKKAKPFIKDKVTRVEINLPNSIAFYNKTMGGVNQMDQNIGAYMINFCNKKWWWSLFCFCGDLAVNNTYQLYRLQPLQLGQKSLNLSEFQREIVNVYFLKLCNTEKILPDIFPTPRKQENVVAAIHYDNERH